MKKKQVTIRLPKLTIEHYARIAKMAGVTPTQVYNVLLATHILRTDAASPRQEEKK